MSNELSGDAALNVVNYRNRSSNRSEILEGFDGACRIIKQVRDLVLGQKSPANELPHQSNQDGAAGISERLGATASKHSKSPRLRAVFCDDEGRLYQIDPQSGKYAPIPIAPKSA